MGGATSKGIGKGRGLLLRGRKGWKGGERERKGRGREFPQSQGIGQGRMEQFIKADAIDGINRMKISAQTCMVDSRKFLQLYIR